MPLASAGLFLWSRHHRWPCYPAVVEILLVLLIFLAVYRVTRLLTEDKIPIIAKPREALIGWLDPWPSEIASGRRQPTGATAKAFAYLLTCPWCASVWVGAGLIPTVAYFTPVPYPWLLWPAASGLTGLLAYTETLIDSRSDLAEARLRLTEAEIVLVQAQTAQTKLTVR